MPTNYPASNLSQENILRDVHDQAEQRLRVDSSVTAVIEDVTINVDLDSTTSSVSIGNVAGTNFLAVNPDGSINVSGVATETTAQSILSSVDNIEPKLDNILAELQQKTEPSDAQNIRVISSATDSISVPGVATDSSLLNILTELQQKTEPSDAQNIRTISSITDSISVPGVATETTLSNINNKLPASLGQKTSANSLSVVLSSDQPTLTVNADLNAFTSTPDSVQLVGSIDGTSTGTKFGFVNNKKQQILDSQDRITTFTYADFGTKNQRVIQIDYNSATFPGTTVRRIFTYTLVGNNYRRDDETWSLV